jgi:hypothetical protein
MTHQSTIQDRHQVLKNAFIFFQNWAGINSIIYPVWTLMILIRLFIRFFISHIKKHANNFKLRVRLITMQQLNAGSICSDTSHVRCLVTLIMIKII